MARNKPRLILALYARPKHPGTYHHALFITPKPKSSSKSSTSHQTFPAIKHHVKNTFLNIDGNISQPWRYERIEISDVNVEQRLLVCVVIGKILASEKIDEVFEGMPIYQGDDEDQVKAGLFSCATWVAAAVEELGRRGLVSGLKEWDITKGKAIEYLERKKEDGRWSSGWEGSIGVPVLDLLTGEEIVS